MVFIVDFASSSRLAKLSVRYLHLLLISIMLLTFGHSYSVVDVVFTVKFSTCYFTLCYVNVFYAVLLCCTVRNQAEMFRDKTGVVLSGRLSRPLGFVKFTAVCAPGLPLVGTVFVCNFDVALYWVNYLGQCIV